MRSYRLEEVSMRQSWWPSQDALLGVKAAFSNCLETITTNWITSLCPFIQTQAREARRMCLLQQMSIFLTESSKQSLVSLTPLSWSASHQNLISLTLTFINQNPFLQLPSTPRTHRAAHTPLPDTTMNFRSPWSSIQQHTPHQLLPTQLIKESSSFVTANNLSSRSSKPPDKANQNASLTWLHIERDMGPTAQSHTLTHSLRPSQTSSHKTLETSQAIAISCSRRWHLGLMVTVERWCSWKHGTSDKDGDSITILSFIAQMDGWWWLWTVGLSQWKLWLTTRQVDWDSTDSRNYSLNWGPERRIREVDQIVGSETER